MTKTLSEHRLQEAFSKLRKIIKADGFIVSDAEKALDLSKRSVSLILSELVEEGMIVRTGEGLTLFLRNQPLWFR